jgi:hypothetical protein
VTLPVASPHRRPLPHALDGGEVLFEVAGAQTPHVYRKWHLLPLFSWLFRVPKAVATLIRVRNNRIGGDLASDESRSGSLKSAYFAATLKSFP